MIVHCSLHGADLSNLPTQDCRALVIGKLFFARSRESNFLLCECRRTGSLLSGILHPSPPPLRQFLLRLSRTCHAPKKCIGGKKILLNLSFYFYGGGRRDGGTIDQSFPQPHPPPVGIESSKSYLIKRDLCTSLEPRV